MDSFGLHPMLAIAGSPPTAYKDFAIEVNDGQRGVVMGADTVTILSGSGADITSLGVTVCVPRSGEASRRSSGGVLTRVVYDTCRAR